MSKLKKDIIYYTIVGVGLAIIIVFLCCIFLVKPAEKQTLNVSCQNEITVELGEEYQVPVECSEPTAQISYYSADEKIIQAKEHCIIGIKEGKTMVRVSAIAGKIYGFQNIYVNVKKTITDLSVSVPENLTLYLLDKSKSKAYADNLYNYYEYTCPYDISYTMSKNDIISIKNNKITALKQGEVNVTFASVSQPEVVSNHKITINKISPILTLTSQETLTLDINQTSKIKYSISPVYYTGEANVSCVFSNPEIASITDKTITTISSGNTSLKIYLNDILVKIIDITVNPLAENTETPAVGDSSIPDPVIEVPDPVEDITDPIEDTPALDDSNSPEEDPNTGTTPSAEEPTEDDPNSDIDDAPNQEPDPEENTPSAPTYTLSLTAYTGCIIEENYTIKVSSSTKAIFSINVLDDKNNPITSEIEVRSEGIELIPLMKGRFAISPSSNCTFTLYFDSLNFSQIINVQLA